MLQMIVEKCPKLEKFGVCSFYPKPPMLISSIISKEKILSLNLGTYTGLNDDIIPPILEFVNLKELQLSQNFDSLIAIKHLTVILT